MRGFVVTGTDTNVGKTVFAAGLTNMIDGNYWKPVQSGLADGGDREAVLRLTGLSEDRIMREAFRLTSPLSPHRAAELDGVTITREALALPHCERPLVVEGAGGVLVPVTRTLSFADLFATWGLPVVLVARTALGTINHSRLSIEALRSRGVPVHGIAFVGDAAEDSEATICALAGARRLGRLPVLAPLSRDSLASAFAAAFSAEEFQ